MDTDRDTNPYKLKEEEEIDWKEGEKGLRWKTQISTWKKIK